MTATLAAWLANLLLIVGFFSMSPRRRWPFLVTVAGEALWLAVGAYRCEPDIVFICAVFGLLAARNYLRWGSSDA